MSAKQGSNMVVFSISEVNKLRSQAETAGLVSNTDTNGWIKCDVDPMKLLAVFETLQIRDGLVLRTYRFCQGGNGNAVVWTMPADAPFPQPVDCSRMEGPPKPPQALDRLMDAIDGDGTPWSYFSASLFAREAQEFGAIWHGCYWSTHAILGTDPWQCEPEAKDRRKRQPQASGKPEEWKWKQPVPKIWEPQFERTGDTISISFLTFSGLGWETIYQTTDSFSAGSYTCKTTQAVVAKGLGGFMF